MLPQKSTILAVMMMATLLSLGSLSSLMPLDVYASHSYEAGVQEDNISDNTHIDLSQLILPAAESFHSMILAPILFQGIFYIELHVILILKYQ
jgi:hypothetical protein